MDAGPVEQARRMDLFPSGVAAFRAAEPVMPDSWMLEPVMLEPVMLEP